MTFQLTGKIKVIGDIEQKSDSFKVRTFVVTTDGDTKFSQHVQLQLANDKCDLLNTFTVGSDVTVYFNLRGREWNNPTDNTVKYFNTLDAWKIDAVTAQNSTTTQNIVENSIPANQIPANQIPVETGGDDLPF